MSETFSTKEVRVNLHSEGRKVWQAFIKTSEEIPEFGRFRDSSYFRTLGGAETGGNLYTYFPFLFVDAFPELSNHRMRQISLMALLYLYHVLIDDDLMDMHKEGVPSRLAILTSRAYCLKALEILNRVLSPKPLPLRQVVELHREYSVANLLESRYHTGVVEQCEREDLFRIVSKKSAMIELIVLALCGSTGRDKYARKLVKSLYFYCLGDNLFDDFRDWKMDFIAGRYSYLLTRVISASQICPAPSPQERSSTVNLIGKHLYSSGIAESYLTEIIHCWQQASDSVRTINCPKWIFFLSTLQLNLQSIRSNLVKELRRISLQEEKYVYRLMRNSSVRGQDRSRYKNVRHPVPYVSSNVDEAAERAVEFLCQRYQPRIGFKDFMSGKGHLTVWVSSYVGCELTEWLRLEHRRAGRKSLGKLLKGMAADIVKKQHDRGWASNHAVSEDVDTTAWALKFLLEVGCISNEIIRRGVGTIKKYQRRNGGFCTFLPEAMGRGFSGWSVSHVEVTAVVLKVLTRAGLELLEMDEEVIERGAKYLKREKIGKHLWRGYWWDGEMFATYHVLTALQTCGVRWETQRRKNLIQRVVSRQSEDGSWGEATLGKNSAFETGLAIRCLLSLDEALVRSSPVKRGIIWLLNHQNTDGGWDSRPMMRIPFGGERAPWNRREWKLDLRKGLGILIRDENLTFTTATVLGTLRSYLSLSKDCHLVVQLR